MNTRSHRREVSNTAALTLALALCVGLVTLIVHPLTLPEGHASYAPGSTATVRTANGYTVAVTIDRIIPNATSNVSTAPGYARYTVVYTLQDDRRAPDTGSFKWEVRGSDGKVYQTFRRGTASPKGTCTGCQTVSVTAFFEVVMPAAVTGQSLTGTLLHEMSIFRATIGFPQGRLHFDGP